MLGAQCISSFSKQQYKHKMGNAIKLLFWFSSIVTNQELKYQRKTKEKQNKDLYRLKTNDHK
jgi:hypothetical protein